MSDNKKQSFFSKLLNRPSEKQETPKSLSTDEELLTCLHNLSVIGEGRDKKVDREIKKFKTLVKIGSTAAALQEQVTSITKALTQSHESDDNVRLIEQFKKMPAAILLDEFIAQPLSKANIFKLKKFKLSLEHDTLAPDTIPNLIELLESFPKQPIENIEDVPEAQPIVEKEQLNEIVKPLLELFSQVQLSTTQEEELEFMHVRSNKMNEIDELCTLIDDICHLILSFIAASTGRFENFLTQLKSRLDTVNTCIISNNETSQALSNCGETFSQCVSLEINNIQTSFAEDKDMINLQQVVSKSLESIISGVSSFDEERKSLEMQSQSRIDTLQEELKKTQVESEQLKENLQQQQDRAMTDPLTALPNRYAYNERLQLEFNRFRRYNKPLSLVMGDIDLFKQINDTHGHLAGDTALKEVAQLLKTGIRSTDFVARFGGEEFVILMPETNISDATKVANQIRKSIQSKKYKHEDIVLNLTISFGVATFDEKDASSDVLERADKALYRAKDKGRNQVCAQRK